MNSYLRITVRFLQPLAHGRKDGDEPEWPPSPLRLFQALTAAAAARWNERIALVYAVPALGWLERQGRPDILAAAGSPSENPHRLYVPDNVGDKVAKSWVAGREASISEYRTEKDVRPTHLSGDAVHFLFPLPDGQCPHFEVLQAAARSVTHLGWGIDMVAGNAELLTDAQVAELKGEVWRPTPDHSGTPLRVPVVGTLDALVEKHGAFLGRLSADGFKPVPPLSKFGVAFYRRATDTAARTWTAFQILQPDASGNRSFDTPRRARDVAAWLRHATGEVCAGWSDLAAFVHGHDSDGSQAKGERADRRFQYLPLPTINHALQRVESIRRVLIAAPPGCQDRIDFIRRRLAGQELVEPGGEVRGLLNILPTGDWVLNQYTRAATTWSTVTPVIWPGYDDRDAGKAEKLLRKAFVDAGISQELVNGIDELEWRHVGFRAGLDLAKNYRRPDHLTGSMYHVRVRFPNPVAGPLAVGAGRYRGFGLFAIDS